MGKWNSEEGQLAHDLIYYYDHDGHKMWCSKDEYDEALGTQMPGVTVSLSIQDWTWTQKKIHENPWGRENLAIADMPLTVDQEFYRASSHKLTEFITKWVLRQGLHSKNWSAPIE